MGVSYGPRALDVIREGSPSALAALGVLVLVAVAVGIIRWSWRRDSDAE